MRGCGNEHTGNRHDAHLLLRHGGRGSVFGGEESRQAQKEGRKKDTEKKCKEGSCQKEKAGSEEKGGQEILTHEGMELFCTETDLEAVVLETEDSAVGIDLFKFQPGS